MSKNSAKVINLADRRAKKEKESRNAPILAYITWLYCPKCKSLEYSELEMPNGRIHKTCGTLVEEEEVQIEVRAEYTISLRNSKRLDELFEETKMPGFLTPVAKKGVGMLESLQAAEKEYRKRLENIVESPIIPYDDDWDELSLKMNFKTLDPYTILALKSYRDPHRKMGLFQ